MKEPESKKKKYNPPVCYSLAIDKQFNMVMMSPQPGNPQSAPSASPNSTSDFGTSYWQ